MLLPFAFVLLADTPTNEVAVGSSIVGVLAMLASGLFTWLSARDKHRHDAMVARLEAKVEALQADVDECRRDRDYLRQQSESQQQEILSLRRQINELTAARKP